MFHGCILPPSSGQWGQYASLKCQSTPMRLHGTTSQKTLNYLTLFHVKILMSSDHNTHFVSSYGVLHKQYSFSFFLPLAPPPPPAGVVPPLPGGPGVARCCFLGRPPPREADDELMGAVETGADFLFPLPVLTSSCLLRSAFVRAANSVDRSFYIYNTGMLTCYIFQQH
jgi:hypothetical protein